MTKNQPPNKSRGCVKSVGVKFGNDQILDMENFDEVSRRLNGRKMSFHTGSRRSQPPLPLAVPLSRFTSRVGGGSAFYVRPRVP